MDELNGQARQALWQEAAKDSLLLKDIEDTEAAFLFADAENLEGADDD